MTLHRLHLPLLRLTLTALIAVALLPAVGCVRQKTPAVKPLRTTILIMDFSVPKEYEQDATRVKRGGWWFGAYRLYQDNNAGRHYADILTEELRQQAGDWVDVFDRLRLRQYFARQRTKLQRSFGSLSDDEIDRLMSQTPPEAFARDLGADKVIVGRIVESNLKINSATRFYKSTVAVEASLIDVDSGKVLWQYQDEKSDSLESEISVMEDVAHRMVRKMMSQYFFRADR